MKSSQKFNVISYTLCEPVDVLSVWPTEHIPVHWGHLTGMKVHQVVVWFPLMGRKGRIAVCILNVGIQQVQSLSLPGWAVHILGAVGQSFVKGGVLVPRYEEGTGVRCQEFGYGCVGNITGRSRVSRQGWCKQLLLWHVRSHVVNNMDIVSQQQFSVWAAN